MWLGNACLSKPGIRRLASLFALVLSCSCASAPTSDADCADEIALPQEVIRVALDAIGLHPLPSSEPTDDAVDEDGDSFDQSSVRELPLRPITIVPHGCHLRGVPCYPATVSQNLVMLSPDGADTGISLVILEIRSLAPDTAEVQAYWLRRPAQAPPPQQRIKLSLAGQTWTVTQIEEAGVHL